MRNLSLLLTAALLVPAERASAQPVGAKADSVVANVTRGPERSPVFSVSAAQLDAPAKQRWSPSKAMEGAQAGAIIGAMGTLMVIVLNAASDSECDACPGASGLLTAGVFFTIATTLVGAAIGAALP
ncbi:MAG: hypothetical protein ACT4OZ_03155 [Gemmatimonadota bacterium]